VTIYYIWQKTEKKIAHSTFFLELFAVMMITDGAYVFLSVLY